MIPVPLFVCLGSDHLILTHPGAEGLFRGRVFVIPGIAEVVLALPFPIVVAVVGFVVVVEVFGPVSVEE